MSDKKLVIVDIDGFKTRLGYRICEDDEDNWTVEQLFEEREDGNGDKFQELSIAGVEKIIDATVGLLNDLDYDQNCQKVPIDEQAANLCAEIEKLGASEQQTKVSLLAAELRQRINDN